MTKALEEREEEIIETLINLEMGQASVDQAMLVVRRQIKSTALEPLKRIKKEMIPKPSSHRKYNLILAEDLYDYLLLLEKEL